MGFKITDERWQKVFDSLPEKKELNQICDEFALGTEFKMLFAENMIASHHTLSLINKPDIMKYLAQKVSANKLKFPEISRGLIYKDGVACFNVILQHIFGKLAEFCSKPQQQTTVSSSSKTSTSSTSTPSTSSTINFNGISVNVIQQNFVKLVHKAYNTCKFSKPPKAKFAGKALVSIDDVNRTLSAVVRCKFCDKTYAPHARFVKNRKNGVMEFSYFDLTYFRKHLKSHELDDGNGGGEGSEGNDGVNDEGDGQGDGEANGEEGEEENGEWDSNESGEENDGGASEGDIELNFGDDIAEEGVIEGESEGEGEEGVLSEGDEEIRGEIIESEEDVFEEGNEQGDEQEDEESGNEGVPVPIDFKQEVGTGTQKLVGTIDLTKGDKGTKRKGKEQGKERENGKKNKRQKK